MISEVRNKLGRAKGYGGCYRCGGTWDYTESHTTYYSGGEGCFPLCEKCWACLTPEERLPYYARLVGVWAASDDTLGWENWADYTLASIEKWAAIKEAVLSGA